MSSEISRKWLIVFFALLLILNIILRFQVVPHEIFPDSVLIHIMVNSLNEYGYARWILHPLSLFGNYPGSECSALQFLLSSIFQCTNLDMESVIFLYCIFIGCFSIFTAYIMAGEIFDNEIFKLLTAFCLSTSPAILAYTTWTIPLRGLFIVFVPLLFYIMIKCPESKKYVLLFLPLLLLLFMTHHLSYFLIPSILIFIVLLILYKIYALKPIKAYKVIPIIPIGCAIFAYSIPVLTGKFLETGSRYAPIADSYVRYVGIPIIFSIGGLFYLIFKERKTFGEWFLLLSLALIIMFIYIETYMKWYMPLLLIPFAALGIFNLINTRSVKKIAPKILTIILITSLCFSAYYQFIHFIPDPNKRTLNERFLEESTYQGGLWMRYYLNGSSISNDRFFGNRIFAISERAYVLVPHLTINQIYGFNKINISEFKRNPITSEEFWFEGYTGPEIAERTWDNINQMYISYQNFGIKYFVENTRTNGDVLWHHGMYPSKLLHYAYEEKDNVYNNGKIRIWKL